MLQELDRELERQGLRFVRYADDFSIYVKTKASVRKVGNTIFKFLKKKLKLTINREKSGIRRPVHFTCLGFGFVPISRKGERGKYQLVVSEKGRKKLKQKLKTITRKTTPMSFDERIEKLGEVQRAGLMPFVWQVFRTNSLNWMGGYETESVTASGTTGVLTVKNLPGGQI